MNRCRKVLYIHHSGVKGGSSNSLRYLIKSLSTKVEPLVITPPGTAAKAFEEAGIRTSIVPLVPTLSSSVGTPLRGLRNLYLLRYLKNLSKLPTIRKILCEFDPGVVHLNERGLLSCARIAKDAGYPVIMHARNVADRDTQWIHSYTIKCINRYTDLLIAIDGSVQHSLREVSRCRIIYNPLGQMPSLLPNAPRETVNFLFLSVLREFKGIWEIADAARSFIGSNIRILIAGSNSRPAAFYKTTLGRITKTLGFTPDAERQLRQKIQKDGTGGVVKLLGHVTDAADLFRQVDVNLFPSHLNGPSRSVFETGVCGIPSIIALRDKVEDVVKHGVNGWIIPEKDTPALVIAMKNLSRDPDLRRRLGAAAREQFIKQFDPERSAQAVMQSYYDVLATHNR
jgi:glycosyltransferase involved in cell wall biosynthesis